MADRLNTITPPPELVERLRSEAPHGIRDAGATRERHLAIAAYRAGADAELEACCEWLDMPAEWETVARGDKESDQLRAARRPKPPSLAEEALKAQQRAWNGTSTHADWELIRAALERLQELENNG